MRTRIDRRPSSAPAGRVLLLLGLAAGSVVACGTSSGVAGAVPAAAVHRTTNTLTAYVSGGRAVDAGAYERGASSPGQPLRATPGIAEFTTPSRNIACAIAGPGDSAGVSCSVRDYSYETTKRPATCHLNYAPGWVSLDARAAHRGLCLGGPPFAPVSRILPYGSRLKLGDFACRSESAYLACADVRTGHGFTVNRTTLKTS